MAKRAKKGAVRKVVDAGGGRAPTARVQVIKEALEALRDRRGRITPEAVVAAARNPTHVLHGEFGWDDQQQANLHRLDRARDLIVRYLTITVIYKNERVTAPYYVRDPTAAPNVQGYAALVGAEMTRANAVAIILAEFDRCASSIGRARRIAHVLDSAFEGVSEQFEILLAKLVELRGSIEKAAA